VASSVESFVKETVSAGSVASMGKAIVDYVDSRRTTLLVMGSRGMGAWTSSLASFIGLGSVSDYVTHHARTPLLPRHLPPYTATLPSIHAHELPRYLHLPQHHHTPHITPFTPRWVWMYWRLPMHCCASHLHCLQGGSAVDLNR
jgi:hypothetical protein